MEILSQILFFIVAFGLIVSALGVVLAPRIIYSVFCAFITFVLVAFVYFMLNAPFNAVCQIAIYGVAVSILFVFSIMLTSYHKEKNLYVALAPRTFLTFLGLLFIFFSIVVFSIEDYKSGLSDAFYAKNIAAIFDTTLEIAKGIFTHYIFAFELLSVFLLIAIVGVGAVTIWKKPENKS